MEMLSQTNNKKKVILFTILIVIVTYLFLLVFLKVLAYDGPTLCIFKLIFNKECPGCGMTRAFYHMLKLDIDKAISFNYRIIIVYPLIWGIYINYIYKKINLFMKENSKWQLKRKK